MTVPSGSSGDSLLISVAELRSMPQQLGELSPELGESWIAPPEVLFFVNDIFC
jgi:hypothetical protein